MNASISTLVRVDAQRVPDHARMVTLPRHFGMHMLRVEGRIYDFMSELCAAYDGGIWQFHELSNGGFYMSPPDGEYEIAVDGNGYRSRMSADAAGLTACLFAFSHLSFEYTSDVFSRHYHWLLEYASHHPEAERIFAAID